MMTTLTTHILLVEEFWDCFVSFCLRNNSCSGHHLFTLILFQTCMTDFFFPCNPKGDIEQNVHAALFHEIKLQKGQKSAHFFAIFQAL